MALPVPDHCGSRSGHCYILPRPRCRCDAVSSSIHRQECPIILQHSPGGAHKLAILGNTSCMLADLPNGDEAIITTGSRSTRSLSCLSGWNWTRSLTLVFMPYRQSCSPLISSSSRHLGRSARYQLSVSVVSWH